VRGAYCNAGVCVAQGAAGAACANSEACQPPAFCESVRGAARTCVVPPSEGGTCDPSWTYPCLSERDYCDPDTLKCTEKKQPGEACSDSRPCVDFASSEAGVCKSVLAGERCESTCYAELTCEATVCTLPPAPSICPPRPD
jgi:hypothetical protein